MNEMLSYVCGISDEPLLYKTVRAVLEVAALPTYTVNDALEDYWRYRVAKSPALSVQTDKSKAKAEIDEKLRACLVSELTTSELERWYCGMVPATEDRERQRRAQSTAERTRRLFFAALNHAYRNRREAVPSADAWRAVRSFRNLQSLEGSVNGLWLRAAGAGRQCACVALVGRSWAAVLRKNSSQGS
jgi:hypothetical protein